MDPENPHQRWLGVATILVVLIVFAADCLTKLGIAVPLLYIGAVWLASFLPNGRYLWLTAALASILTAAGFYLSPQSDADLWVSVVNRLILIMAIWFTAFPSHWNRTLLKEQASLRDSLESQVEQRTAELRASEERFDLAVRGSTDGLWDWDVPTGVVYYSPRMKFLIGFSEDEFPHVFASFESRLHPDDHDRVMHEVQLHLTMQKPYDVQYRLRTKSGPYRWFRARGQAVWNDAGEPQRMAGSITDVTEEYSLRERFRIAVEASPSALMMVKHDRRIVMANSFCLKLFGYEQAELIGQLVEVVVPDRFRAEHPAKVRQFFEKSTQREMGAGLELFAIRKDGTEFPVQIGLSPIDTADGPMVICGILDITDQKKTIEAMRIAKEAAESASRAKSSFLANMSHEIRTPMNGILGMTQLLARTELRSHQREYLETVEDSAHILMRLLNDILDLSKIEAGKLRLESEDFRIAECVSRASQMLVLRAAEKGLEFACRVAPEIPNHLRGDSGRLQQVLVNLLGNAVKFTEAGEIFLNVNSEEITADRIRLHFSVTDTGIGIPADKQDQIFHPFEQAEASTTRRFGGSGLGLTISRQLVEMMQGRIWVESELGRGSTFHFTAEFGVTANQHLLQPVELESLRELPVLVVDDNFTNRRILGEMLKYWHMQPILADSAASARDLLRRAEASQQPIRLILLDHHMPGEDGFQFVESVQSLLQRDQCSVIMISSGSSPVDAGQFERYGIDRFMTKPVIASDLLNQVLHQFGQRAIPDSRRTVSGSLEDSRKVEPRRVLLVEDNEINRRVAVGLMRSRGHSFEVVENGLQAVEILADQEFDVVLMDMQMPVMDGYEATAEIRKRERDTGGHVPIVAMTAEALKGDRERCLAAGMDDYVSKPISPQEMYRAIERFPSLCMARMVPTVVNFEQSNSSELASAASRSSGDAANPADTSIAVPPSSFDKVADQPSSTIDWSKVKEFLGGEAADLRAFSEVAKVETSKLMAEIRSAIEVRDAKVLRRAAHSLKGSVHYFGVEPLVQAALALELRGRDESFAGISGLYETLEREFSRFRKSLELGSTAEG